MTTRSLVSPRLKVVPESILERKPVALNPSLNVYAVKEAAGDRLEVADEVSTGSGLEGTANEKEKYAHLSAKQVLSSRSRSPTSPFLEKPSGKAVHFSGKNRENAIVEGQSTSNRSSPELTNMQSQLEELKEENARLKSAVMYVFFRLRARTYPNSIF